MYISKHVVTGLRDEHRCGSRRGGGGGRWRHWVAGESSASELVILATCMYVLYLCTFFFFSLLLRAELWVLSSLDILLPSPDPLCPSAQDSTRLASPPLRIASAHATTRSRVQSTSGASNHCQTLVPMPCHGSHWPVWALTAPWKST